MQPLPVPGIIITMDYEYAYLGTRWSNNLLTTVFNGVSMRRNNSNHLPLTPTLYQENGLIINIQFFSLFIIFTTKNYR